MFGILLSMTMRLPGSSSTSASGRSRSRETFCRFAAISRTASVSSCACRKIPIRFVERCAIWAPRTQSVRRPAPACDSQDTPIISIVPVATTHMRSPGTTSVSEQSRGHPVAEKPERGSPRSLGVGGVSTPCATPLPGAGPWLTAQPSGRPEHLTNKKSVTAVRHLDGDRPGVAEESQDDCDRPCLRRPTSFGTLHVHGWEPQVGTGARSICRSG